jgi:hypothetical protein
MRSLLHFSKSHQQVMSAENFLMTSWIEIMKYRGKEGKTYSEKIIIQ